MNVDNRVIFNVAKNYANDASAQLKQPQVAQDFFATHQLKHQQQSSEGRIVTVEEQNQSANIKNEKEGGGAFYEASEGGERDALDGAIEHEEDSLPGVTLGDGRKMKVRGPNNPMRFDVSI